MDWGERMRRLMFVLTMLATAPAWADTQPPAESLARQIVEQAEAADLFEIVPNDQNVIVRHTRSGLVCRMDPDATNRIIVFPQAARGEDVACDSTDGHESTTLYATRFSFDTSLQEQIQGAEAAIHHRFPNARPLSGTADDTPGSRTVEFMITRDGAQMYTRASVTLVNGWAIKLRYTEAAPDQAATERARATAAAIWRSVVAEVTSGRVS